MKRRVLILIIAAAIVLAAMYFKPSAQPVPASNLTISNFTFAEQSAGASNHTIKIDQKVIFEGPITKPTPCNGLTANYTASGNAVKITIETTPFEGFCSQVITNTFYKGSFDVSEIPADGLKVELYYGGQLIHTGTITSQSQISLENACISSGGTVSTSSCCLSAVDFPNSCLIGACGCSPDNSHAVKVCNCDEGKCFDGHRCI